MGFQSAESVGVFSVTRAGGYVMETGETWGRKVTGVLPFLYQGYKAPCGSGFGSKSDPVATQAKNKLGFLWGVNKYFSKVACARVVGCANPGFNAGGFVPSIKVSTLPIISKFESPQV